MNQKEEGPVCVVTQSDDNQTVTIKFIAPWEHEMAHDQLIGFINMANHVVIQDYHRVLSKCDWEDLFSHKEPNHGTVLYTCYATLTCATYNTRVLLKESRPDFARVLFYDCYFELDSVIPLQWKHVSIIQCRITDRDNLLMSIAPHVEELHMKGTYSGLSVELAHFPKLHTLECSLLFDFSSEFSVAANFPKLRQIIAKDELHGWFLDKSGHLMNATKPWKLLAVCKSIRNLHRKAQTMLYLSLRRLRRLPKDVIKLICHQFVPLMRYQAYCYYDLVFENVQRMALSIPGGMTSREYEALKDSHYAMVCAQNSISYDQGRIRDMTKTRRERDDREATKRQREKLEEDIELQEAKLAANKLMFDTFVKRRKIKTRKPC